MLKIDNSFVETYNNLVYSIVNKYAKNYNREDLYQVGMLAAIKATEMYDQGRGIKFSTFAYKYILGEILKYIREDKVIRQSRDIIKNYVQILYTKEQFFMINGRNITDKEISKITGLSEEKINEVVDLCKNVESLDYKLNDEDTTLLDMIEDKNKLSKEDLISLKDAYQNLTNEEKNFIYERYYENKTQTQIAKENNINQVKVYRYEREILDKMKNELV